LFALDNNLLDAIWDRAPLPPLAPVADTVPFFRRSEPTSFAHPDRDRRLGVDAAVLSDFACGGLTFNIARRRRPTHPYLCRMRWYPGTPADLVHRPSQAVKVGRDHLEQSADSPSRRRWRRN